MAFITVWDKYLPAIKILLKKAATAEQMLGMNRTDFERAAGIKKSGYRFAINFINGKADRLFNGNDIAKAFIMVLATDSTVQTLLTENDYTFSFSSKYQLQIKSNSLQNEALLPGPAEKTLPD